MRTPVETKRCRPGGDDPRKSAVQAGVMSKLRQQMSRRASSILQRHHRTPVSECSVTGCTVLPSCRATLMITSRKQCHGQIASKILLHQLPCQIRVYSTMNTYSSSRNIARNRSIHLHHVPRHVRAVAPQTGGRRHGQRQCSRKGHQSRNETHRNSTCTTKYAAPVAHPNSANGLKPTRTRGEYRGRRSDLLED